MLASVVGNFNNFNKVGWVLGLDVRICASEDELPGRGPTKKNLPIESLIRRPSNWAFASLLQTSGLLTLFA